jgi:hypothetical protein
LRQILAAAVVQQADAADIDRLLAKTDRAAADIDIRVPDGGDDLRQRHVVSVKLVEIDLDFEFLSRAAPGIHLHDAGNGQQPALHDPILDGAEIGQAEMRRSCHLVAVDFADQARTLDRGNRTARQIDVLLQTDRRLLKREIIVDAVVESDSHKRQAVERRRADDVDAGRGGEPHLHGDGVVAFNLFGGETVGLSGDLQDHRRRIGICLNVELAECK